jgi:hypothetical protein
MHLRLWTIATLSTLALALGACGGSGISDVPPPPSPACLGAYEFCGTGAACCSGSCASGTCACSPLGGDCGTSADCCDGASARRCTDGTCETGCRPLGDVCDWAGDCCTSNCDATGHCAPTCLSYGSSCSASSQCCSGLGCASGTCSWDCATSGACTNDDQCCSGYGCRAGRCQAGACGTLFHACETHDDCCTAAQGGKNYLCGPEKTCVIGMPGDACDTNADCSGSYPCRNGYCNWTNASRADGQSCLDDLECKSGTCTSSSPGVPGICCSGQGTSCVAGGYGTVCCEPLTCTGAPGAQTCGTCLDWTNSGEGKANQCTSTSQCCPGQGLVCSAGECCERRGESCSSADQCCLGQTCGDVTTWQGTQSSVCCGDFEGSCWYDSDCCDGYLCANAGNSTPTKCLKAPGQACAADAECADWEGCKIQPGETTGTCCSHEMGSCKSDSDCCSGICDLAMGLCEYAPEYGDCLVDNDCSSGSYGDYPGPICGGNANVGPLTCCPVPGDTCQSAADCCEEGNSCKTWLSEPTYGADMTTPVCCRETQASCTDDAECCTGVCLTDYGSGYAQQKCCAYPYMTTFTCTADADCCYGSGDPVYARTACSPTTNRCCWKAGQNAWGDASLCCSGQVDKQTGYCKP